MSKILQRSVKKIVLQSSVFHSYNFHFVDASNQKKPCFVKNVSTHVSSVSKKCHFSTSQPFDPKVMHCAKVTSVLCTKE